MCEHTRAFYTSIRQRYHFLKIRFRECFIDVQLTFVAGCGAGIGVTSDSALFSTVRLYIFENKCS